MRNSSLATLSIVCTCFAQTPAPAPATSLTLPQAVNIAIQNHPQIATAQNTEAAAGQRVIETRSAYYPAITGEITGSQANSLSRLGAGLINTPSLFSHEGDGIAVNQLISDFGRTGSLVASSRLEAQAAAQTTLAT